MVKEVIRETVFYFLSSPSAQAATSSTPSGFFYGVISVVILTFIGQWIGYWFQGKSKLRETADVSKSMLQYVNMVLCFEYAQIANIKKILEKYAPSDSNRLRLQPFILTPLIVNVKEKYLQK